MRYAASNAIGRDLLSRRSLTRRFDCDPGFPSEIASWLWSENADRLLDVATLVRVDDRFTEWRFDHPHGPLQIRRYASSRWLHAATTACRVPASRNAFEIGAALAEAGVPTPRPRASLEHRAGPLVYRSYLVTDHVAGTTLYRLIRSGAVTSDGLPRLARQIAAIWQRLIELGICHNDLRPESFIVDSSHSVWLLNLERARRYSGRHAIAKPRRGQLDDLQRFLHVRTWRKNPAAVEPFRRALVEGTQLGQWLWEGVEPGLPSCGLGYSRDELSSGLSVLVVTGDMRDTRGIAESVASVEGVADEIFLVASSPSREGYDVLRQFPTLGDAGPSPARGVGGDRGKWPTKSTFPRQPWLLILRPGEVVTPELARRLPEQIVERTDCDAYRIPVAGARSNRWMPRGRSNGTAPIRLLHQGRCGFSLRGDQLLVFVDPRRVGQFSERLWYGPPPTLPVAVRDSGPMPRAA